MMKKLQLILVPLLTASISLSNVHGESLTLKIPIIDDSPHQHEFYHELLETALKEAGHNPTLIPLRLPQLRTAAYLDKGKISAYWMVGSQARNEKYVAIKVGLTNGLIGKRILFIKKGDQYLYDNVKTVKDFRDLQLIGGMGKNWFDVKIWKANKLKYKEHEGNWKAIFKMIPKRPDYNYFSRGINEILTESKQYPLLAIENNLVLIYDRDIRFYLSKTGKYSGEKYKVIIEGALVKAEESGLIEKLVRKYWANDFKVLKFDKRIKLNLVTPK